MSTEVLNLAINYIEQKEGGEVICRQRDDLLPITDRITNFIADNYLPYRAGSLLTAGKIVYPNADAPSEVEIHIAGNYWWKPRKGDTQLFVDGKEAPNPIRLEDGNYQFAWEGNQPLMICIRDKEDWKPVSDVMGHRPKVFNVD